MLEEHQILLTLQEVDLEVHEVKLAEEKARGMHPFDGWDLLAEMEELHARVAGVKDECAAEGGKLSTLVMGISNALVALGMLPIWDIPQLLKIAWEVLAAAGLIQGHLREEHASSADPWD
jgi:hypothetical protein